MSERKRLLTATTRNGAAPGQTLTVLNIMKILNTDDPSPFPPNMHLSDAWVAIILQAGFTGRERGKKWPLVFGSKYLRPEYVNKGRPAKLYSMARKEWVHAVACNTSQLFGREGVEHEILKFAGMTITGKGDLVEGDRCIVQSDEYTYPEAGKMGPPKPVRRDTTTKPLGPVSEFESEDTSLGLKRKAEKAIDVLKSMIPEKLRRASSEQSFASSKIGRKPTGLIKVPADVYSDDEEPGEPAECEACEMLQKENQELHDKLRKTEAKFLSLADALEATHSVIDPIQQRLLESQRLVRAASKLCKHLDSKKKEVQDAAETLTKLHQYPKEHANTLTNILAPCNEAHEEFHARYPVLADRIMVHGDGGPSSSFNAWFQTDVPGYGRLFDMETSKKPGRMMMTMVPISLHLNNATSQASRPKHSSSDPLILPRDMCCKAIAYTLCPSHSSTTSYLHQWHSYVYIMSFPLDSFSIKDSIQ